MADPNNYNSSNPTTSPYLKKGNEPDYRKQQNPSNAPPSSDSTGAVKLCFAVSEMFGQQVAKVVGDIAEAYINYRLIPDLLRYKISLWELYWDPSFEGVTYIGFLRGWNSIPPGVDDILGAARPDILIHNPSMMEYYEIKPDSLSGRSAGYKKLRDLIGIYNSFGLPYKQGRIFVPPETIEIAKSSFMIAKVPVPVKLAFGLRKEGALIVYNLCITTNWVKVLTSEAFIKALIETIFDLLKQAIKESKVIFEMITDYVKNNWGAIALGAGGAIVLAVLVALTSEITIPAYILESLAEFFASALAARGMQLAF